MTPIAPVRGRQSDRRDRIASVRQRGWRIRNEGGLCDRRCGVGRVRIGKSAQRRSWQPRRITRSRRAGFEPADPYPGWLYEIARPPDDYLGLYRRARSRHQWPRHPLSARPGAWRIEFDQWHDLCPRPARGFRPLGPARQSRLVMGRRAAVFQKGGELGARAGRISRAWRTAVDIARLRQAAPLREDDRGRDPDRSRIPRGRQSSAARGRRQYRLGAADPPRPPAPECGANLFARRGQAAQSADHHRRASASRGVRRHPRCRRRIRPQRPERCARAGRCRARR